MLQLVSRLKTKYDKRFARQYRYEPPSEFPLTSPFSGIVHHLSGPNRCAHTQTSLNRSVGCWCKYPSSHFHCASRFTHPGTCTYVRLLGPCFKTGRVKPFCHHIHVKGCNSDQTSPEHEAREEMSPEAMLQDTQYSVQRWVLQGTFGHPWANYHVPWVFLNSKLTLTRKARSTTHIQIRAHHTPCGDAAHTHFSTQQSHQDTLVPFASLIHNFMHFRHLSKVPFVFLSWPFTSIIHHLSGPNECAHIQTLV